MVLVNAENDNHVDAEMEEGNFSLLSGGVLVTLLVINQLWTGMRRTKMGEYIRGG